ncbi:MAG: transposase [Tateyamaria sp.]|uniref:REP-associated tyrosine transposase n=1 Tax=Tateyamaria sp. TaxID=1929288 RepID=UPI00329CF2FD
MIHGLSMPNYRRPQVTGACVFFTVTLARRGGWTLVQHIDDLRDAVRITRAERPFEIDAFVVMPDHLHCVWTLPAGDRDFSTRWRLIKSRFSRRLPKGPTRKSHDARNERGIWQRRFWEHHIRDETDYWAHIHYCWMNPVKHGFVERPEDWAYSSVHNDARFKKGDE